MTGRRHSRREWCLFLQATATLLTARAALKLVSFRSIARALGLQEGHLVPVRRPSEAARAEMIGWAVRGAAGRLPCRSSCLVEALAAAAMLRGHGLPGKLSFGVGKGETPEEGVSAHAWLECGDLILTGQGEREQFTELVSFALPRRIR